MDINNIITKIETLGKANIISPLENRYKDSDLKRFVCDDDRILISIKKEKLVKFIQEKKDFPSFEQAGPRKKIYFDPSKVKCAIVTCGGLCPGLNDVIRAICLELYHCYGVSNIYGIKYGLQGFIPKYKHEIKTLTPKSVLKILDMGGTILGSSRGEQKIELIVDCLERENIGILFMLGGDGTLMASEKIAEEINKRNLKISVISIPKTIDNDIYLVSKSFGFDTAVDIATNAIKSAHNEALGYPNGIGLIKLMGRHSGFLAIKAALAQQDANFVLIPEVDFDLNGDNGLLNAIETRLKKRKHAVIIVAEGAGQKFFKNTKNKHDASGNIKLNDIGIFLKQNISNWFAKKNIPLSLKYIDPSYIIRSLPANANDSVYCALLGRDAVHAGMAGKTKLLISYWNNHYVHIPMKASAGKRKKVDPKGKLWLSVQEATGQGNLVNI